MSLRLLLPALTLIVPLTGCRTASPNARTTPPPAAPSRPAVREVTLEQRIYAALGRDFFENAQCAKKSLVTVYGRKVTKDSKHIRATGPFVALIHGMDPGSSMTLIWGSSRNSTLQLATDDDDPSVLASKGSSLHSLRGEETRPWVALLSNIRHF